MSSIVDLEPCARRHLDHYTDPAGPRAFRTYDRQGDPTCFEPCDALAPTLLSARISGQLVVKLFANAVSPYGALRQAIDQMLAATAEAEPAFEQIDLADPNGSWRLVSRIIELTQGTKGIKAAMVTKMLHRKRPCLVPIFDSRVAAFYDATSNATEALSLRLQHDLLAGLDLLKDLATGMRTPDDRPLSLLRTLDIIVWEHQVTSCSAS